MDHRDHITVFADEQPRVLALPPPPSEIPVGVCEQPHFGHDSALPVTAYHFRDGQALCDECALAHDRVGEFGEAA